MSWEVLQENVLDKNGNDEGQLIYRVPKNSAIEVLDLDNIQIPYAAAGVVRVYGYNDAVRLQMIKPYWLDNIGLRFNWMAVTMPKDVLRGLYSKYCIDIQEVSDAELELAEVKAINRGLRAKLKKFEEQEAKMQAALKAINSKK